MAVAQAQYPVAELTRQPARQGRRRPVRHPPGRRPAARAHERAAGRGEGALRHRPGDGRDQRRLRRHRRRARHRRQRHRQPRRHRRPGSPDRRHARAQGLGGRATSSCSSARWPPATPACRTRCSSGRTARCSSATPGTASRTSSRRLSADVGRGPGGWAISSAGSRQPRMAATARNTGTAPASTNVSGMPIHSPTGPATAMDTRHQRERDEEVQAGHPAEQVRRHPALQQGAPDDHRGRRR